MEHQASPNELWLYSWVLANTPWIYAGCVSAFVRFVFLFGKNAEPFRRSISDAIICGAIVSVSSPALALVGLDSQWAMAAGVGVGLVGPEVVKADIAERIKAAIKAGFGSKQ